MNKLRIFKKDIAGILIFAMAVLTWSLSHADTSQVALTDYTQNSMMMTDNIQSGETAAAIPTLVVIATALVIGGLVSVASTCHDTKVSTKTDIGTMKEEDFHLNLLP